jgi:hypothetical protein
MVVAPYNAQVRLLRERLPVAVEVGTVDKFQGREAPVAIYSMTTSTPDDAPRDPDFLYSGNRLNVALSRARGLAVLVASPALLRVACRSPEEIRLVNAFCRFIEVATAQAGPAEPRAAVALPVGVVSGGSGEPVPGPEPPARTILPTTLVLFPDLEADDPRN